MLASLMILSCFLLQPLQIKSVVSKESLKGYIYIEAYKQTHVKQAIQDIGSLKMGVWSQQVSLPQGQSFLLFTNRNVFCIQRNWYDLVVLDLIVMH